MARTRCCCRRTYPTDVTKCARQCGIWLQRWSKNPTSSARIITKDVQKFRVYYSNAPKKIQILNLRIQDKSKHSVEFRVKGQGFALETVSHFQKQSTSLGSNLLAPRPVGFDMHFKEICKKAHLLKVCQFYKYRTDIQSALARTFRVNKNLKELELDGDASNLNDTFPCLKYIQSLESIYLKQIPSMPIEQSKKPFLTSHRSLKRVTLTGRLDNDHTTLEITQFIRAILELPHLKTFNFDAKTPPDFEINNIPFNVLKKRDISYNVRFVNSTSELNLSNSSQLGLEAVEFLGVNCIGQWHNHKTKEDMFQEQHLEAQEKMRKVFFVSLFEMQKVNLSLLFEACRNIVTLDLSLSISTSLKNISFAGLRNLKNLQNIFITIDNLEAAYLGRVPLPITTCCSVDLFKNLVFCAPRLKSVHIHLTGETLPKDEEDILAFFNSCSETLTHFTFMYSCYMKIPQKKIQVFYKGLALLKNLQSLTLLYNQVRAFKTSPKYIEISKIIKCQNLRELYISLISIPQSQVSLPKLNNLQRLGLEVNQNQLNRDLLKNLEGFVNLKCFELYIQKTCEKLWFRLLSTIQKLNKLEILRIKYDATSLPKGNITELLEDLKLIKQNHENLHAISFRGCPNYQEVVWQIGGSYPNQRNEDEKFYARESINRPKHIFYKIYSL